LTTPPKLTTGQIRDALRELADLSNEPTDTGERPVNWLLVLRAACALSEAVEPEGQFAGRWVIDRVRRQPNASWRVPGLRRLSARGLIVKVYDSRGGNRAYYRMPQRKEIEALLDQQGVPQLSAP
jgi:hypothetical protein